MCGQDPQGNAKPTMPFDQAAKFVLMFGKYKHLPTELRTLEQIATTDAGLLYLDWLRGSLHESCLDWQLRTRDALDAYLMDESIARHVSAAMERQKNKPSRGSGTWADRQRAETNGW